MFSLNQPSHGETRMGEAEYILFQSEFNHGVRVERARFPLTEDTGVLVLRELADGLGLKSVVAELVDHRKPERITHPLYELVLSRVLLLAQGWRDQDDGDLLRDDPAFRLAVSTRGGDRALKPARDPLEPEGLASQPTLSRLTAMLASLHNRRVLARGLLALARERMRRQQGRRHRLVLDVDSFPLETYGRQEGAAYNGHYRMEGYHPLIAFTDTGDLVGLMLRPGNVHTAKDVRRFLTPLLSGLQEDCDELLVRIDAGYADGKFFAWLAQRGVRFVTRLRRNSALHRAIEKWERKTLAAWEARPAPDGRPRHATREFWLRPRSWSLRVRVVAVLVERDAGRGELFHHTFYLATNFARAQATSEGLLELYRQRGRAEAHIGEFKRVIAPRLSSVPRPRQGAPPRKRRVGMAENEVTLLLAAFAYQLVHALRSLLEEATGEGISLERVRERVLKVATAVVFKSRRVVFRIASAKVALWKRLSRLLRIFLSGEEVTA